MIKKEKKVKEINLVPLLKALLLKLWLMLIVGVVFAALAFGATKLFVQPTYRSGFTAYVNNQHSQVNKDTLNYSDLNAAKELVRTYAYIIRSNSVLTAAAESIDLDLSYDALKGMVSTEIQDETEIIYVYVVHRDPQIAYDLADAIAKTAPEFMSSFVEGSSMKIIDYPEYSNKRYKPSYTQYAIFGFIFGVLLVAVKVIIDYLRNDLICDESELEERYSIPILGVLPDFYELSNNKEYYEKGYAHYKKPNNLRGDYSNEK